MAAQDASLQSTEAFCQLYNRNHLAVFRYIYGLKGGPAEEVEDLTAETFFKAWRGRSGFRGDEQAAFGWLLHIARNLVIDSYRRKKTHGVQQDIDGLPLPTQEAGPEEQATHNNQMEELWRRLQTLPEEQREIIVLRYLLDWPVQRIAAHIGMLDNTVSVTLRRSLQKLRQGWPESEK